jgi:anhydro-N-acetylmuramic acid kinase
MNRTPITGIGLMCGTSLDALDVASVTFLQENGCWKFTVNQTRSFDLPNQLRDRIRLAKKITAIEFVKLDRDFAEFSAKSLSEFLLLKTQKIEFIASHGVTIFHQPEQRLSIQIGSGAIIAAKIGIPVISNFRSQDIAKGGQGAPLVPYADSLLFSEYDALVNLGGFANISCLLEDSITGYDICPCNMALNDLYRNAQEIGQFDKNGDCARQGQMDDRLLNRLNQLNYYLQKHPKSLGSEWYESIFRPLILPAERHQDNLRTVVEHIAIQISRCLPKTGRTLFTGGGAHNNYLLERINAHSSSICVLPSSEIIDFKEAIEFAFLGALRLIEKTNISKSVTGAKTDSIAGSLYLP